MVNTIQKTRRTCLAENGKAGASARLEGYDRLFTVRKRAEFRIWFVERRLYCRRYFLRPFRSPLLFFDFAVACFYQYSTFDSICKLIMENFLSGNRFFLIFYDPFWIRGLDRRQNL